MTPREEKRAKKVCVWKWNNDGFWATACGYAQEFSAGDIKENGYKFCPSCGKKIKEKRNG